MGEGLDPSFRPDFFFYNSVIDMIDIDNLASTGWTQLWGYPLGLAAITK